MIEKIYESYDDNQYYIDTNKKKLAADNLAVIGIMLAFFIAVSIVFVALALAFGTGLDPYGKFIPAIGVLIILHFIHSVVGRKLSNDFNKVRIYAFMIYTLVIISFSLADAMIYNTSRAVFFPVAIALLSQIYLDYSGIVITYKLLLAVAFLIIEAQFKERTLVMHDGIVAVLIIIASTFCYAAVIRATLARHEDNEKLVQKSETDLLTGLLNKISFEEKCTNYLENRMIGAKCTMFIFDLDDFKDVNDHFGHQTGDKTLKLFAELLRGYFHPDDIIGRIGGDEFMVLVLGDMPEGFAERRCRSVIHELKTTNIDGAMGITCSIGIAEDTQRRTFEEMYNAADAALYRAKQTGKARFEMLNCEELDK
ncbi:GGDEF domain-containing protein [Butyrivibrio sp. FCS014]|uniref:GGDEF domain-containing protein n=1 Tax=Butyrivibrio sp. FCS014 TaxID=1408304 RepID=UPI00046394A8|nr:GGDEF domain-containing protein [Butyrivibrio sp. FCS014]